jgi:mRNA interferase RelE/StbE
MMVGNKPYTLLWHPDAATEYRKLNRSQTVAIDKGLARIEQFGMQSGERLHGELRMCRRLKYKKLGLRIIFTSENQEIKIIRIIAIGKRENNQVYSQATSRLPAL